MNVRTLYPRIKEEFPTLIRKGNNFFFPIQNGILSFIAFETSPFSREKFYVTVAIMPIYYPETSLSLNFGFRLSNDGGTVWKTEDSLILEKLVSKIREEGLPYLESLRSPSALISFLQTTSELDLFSQRAVAFSYARAKQWLDAVRELRKTVKKADESIPWQVEIQELSLKLKKLIEDSNEEAFRQLCLWEAETYSKLRLDGVPRLD